MISFTLNTTVKVLRGSQFQERGGEGQKAEARQQDQCLGKKPHKTLLPSLFLTNARSVVNKMNELKLQLVDNRLVRDRVPVNADLFSSTGSYYQRFGSRHCI